MKKNFKRVLSAILVCTMIATSSAAVQLTGFADDTSVTGSDKASSSVKIRSKKLPFYLYTKDPGGTLELNVYYVNGSDVPYLDLMDFGDLLMRTYKISRADNEWAIEPGKKDDKFIYTRKDVGYTAVFDFEKDTIEFIDYNAFVAQSGSTIIEPIAAHLYVDEKGRYSLIKPLKSSTERYGDPVTMDLGAYDIDFVRDGDNYYVPAQTLSDVFMSPNCDFLLYNEKCFIVNSGDSLVTDGVFTDLGKEYYSAGTKKKFSKAMTQYNYNELCFALDHLYGLKEQHNIESFDKLVMQRGYKNYFLSGLPKYIDYALYDIIYNCIDDLHSSLFRMSYASGPEYLDKLKKKGQGRTRTSYMELLEKTKKVREQFSGSSDPEGYVEVGDTAYIVFDRFSALGSGIDYYTTAPTNDANDTIGLMAYSVQQILRKGSPIKNVVLDLSCNGGGVVDAAVYVVAAFLGKASISYEDPNTGARVTKDYLADTNFDHKFNSKDTLADKGLNLYCMTSKLSFSCGNLVPSVFKEEPTVTMLGKTSGGGACLIGQLSTAIGDMINISSSNRISALKNGSFYDVDRGVEPDFAIDKMKNFYDREALTKFIDDLF